jgi:hypothetical protein
MPRYTVSYGRLNECYRRASEFGETAKIMRKTRYIWTAEGFNGRSRFAF